MKRNLVVALALFAIGCGTHAPGGKTPPTDEFQDLTSLDEKSDAFSSKWKLNGSLTYGDQVTTKYTSTPRFRAYKFAGQKGDQVDITVSSKVGDPVTWLLDNSYRVLESNDDADATTTDSHLTATLPGNTNAAVVTYYIVFRDYWLDPASFTVKLAGVPVQPDFYACNVDADCVKTYEGCCAISTFTSVVKGTEAAYHASLGCAVNPICPKIAVRPTADAPECVANKCTLVKPADILCGVRTSNPHSCPDAYVCSGPNLASDGGGHCYQSCGGIAGRPCDAGMSCVDDPADGCDPAHGGADCGGLCKPAPTDCRTSGCATGSYCSFCWGSYSCIPNGALC
jgi:hypothetical protein